MPRNPNAIRLTEAQARAAGLLPKRERKAPTPPQERPQRPRRAEKAVTWYWARRHVISHLWRRVNDHSHLTACGRESSGELYLPDAGWPRCQRCERIQQIREKEAKGE